MSYINCITYSIYNDAEIRAPDVSIKSSGNKDETDSIYDPRLGVNQYICTACNQSDKTCMGHFGKIYTNVVIPNPAFMSSKTVTDFIKNICVNCHMLKPITHLDAKTKNRVDKLSIYKKKDRKELKQIALENNLHNFNNKKCNNKVCKNRSCNSDMTMFDKRTGIFKKKTGTDKTIDIKYETVYSLIRQNRTYCYLLGINTDPVNFFYNRFIPIPPITVRTSNFFYSGSSKKSYNELGSNISALVKVILNKSGEINNESKESMVYKHLLSIDEGKNKIVNTGDTYENNIRYSAMFKKFIGGRRIDNIGRFVIGPADEDIKLGEISIPKAALKITKRFYINYITLKYPNIDYIINNAIEHYNNTTKQLTNLKNKNKTIITVHPGDWLTVLLEENDFMLFGREPSLHKYNVQGSKLKINDSFTLKLPQSVITSQNADFDGDEEWICRFTTVSALVEAHTLLNPVESISMGVGYSAFNLLQDEIISLHLLSMSKKITVDQCNFIMGKLYKTNKELSGKELINLFLYNKKNKPLTADDLGYSKKNSILINELAFVGPNKALRALDNLSYIAKRYSIINLLSIGLDSLKILEFQKIKQKRILILNALFKKYEEYFLKVKEKKIVPFDEDLIYQKIFQLFTNFQLENISVVKDFYENTLFNSITSSKTKVSYQNLSSIVCMGGTVDNFEVPTLFNKRNPYKYNNIPSFDEFGFIKSSMLDGENFDEYIVRCNDGRKKAVNVVCQTSDAGDIYKRLIKKFEDCLVNNVGFLMHNNYVILQSPYYLKITENDIRFIKYIFPDDVEYNNELDNTNLKKRILKLHQDNYEYVYKYVQNISDKTIFYFDLPLVLSSYDFNAKYTKYKDVDSFCEHIDYFISRCSKIYYFDLVNLDFVKYVLLTYLAKYNNLELNNFIFDKIEFMLLTSLNAGENIISIIQTTAAANVQAALSSFHTVTKGGAKIEQSGGSSFKKLIVNNKNVIGKIKILTRNINIIKKIKYAFNYLNLTQFSPIVEFSEYEKKNKIKITFVKKKLLKKILVHELIYMVYNYIYNYRNVVDFEINIKNEDTQYIEFNILIVFDQLMPSSKYYEFIKGLNFGIYRGKVYNNNINIDYKYKEKTGFYELTTYIINLNEILDIISNEEMNEISITPNYIIAEEIYGSVIASFFFCKEIYDINAGEEGSNINEENIFAIDIISKLLSKNGIINGILSTKDMTSEKACQSGSYKRYINSAIKNSTDLIEDNTSRLVNTLPLRIGTGYNEKFIDLNMLERMIPENKIKVNNEDISEISEASSILI